MTLQNRVENQLINNPEIDGAAFDGTKYRFPQTVFGFISSHLDSPVVKYQRYLSECCGLLIGLLSLSKLVSSKAYASEISG